jgi:hypothetical protein
LQKLAAGSTFDPRSHFNAEVKHGDRAG